MASSTARAAPAAARPHWWFVDPLAMPLEALGLDGPTYRIREVHTDDAVVRVAPFDAIELELAALWSV